MITSEKLHSQWAAVLPFGKGFLQVEAGSPLDWHVGFEGIEEPCLVMISTLEPAELNSSKSIVVSKRRRPDDSRWTLTFTLKRSEQISVFEILCADIVSSSENVPDEKQALEKLSARYKQWHKLLERQKTSLMDESSRKGLLGELLYLRELIEGGLDPLTAVQGWTGPDGADQDFVYADGWREIKSVGISSAEVMISSLEQLANPDQGELVVLRIDKCAPQQAGACSLGEAVDLVLKTVEGNADAKMLLEHKLTRYGYIDIPEYRKQKYKYSSKARYSVDSTFPKLTVDTVPSQVIKTQYALSLAGIDDWRLED